MKYSDYTHYVSGEPSYYNVDEIGANKIFESLNTLIKNQFPGIHVEKHYDGQGSCRTTGPAQEVCDEIDEWVSNNWTAAL